MERQSKLGIQISYCKIPTQSFPSMSLQIELQPRHIKKSEKMNFHDTMLQKTCRSITNVFISKDIPLYRMKLVVYLRINIVYFLHNQIFSTLSMQKSYNPKLLKTSNISNISKTHLFERLWQL